MTPDLMQQSATSTAGGQYRRQRWSRRLGRQPRLL